MYYLIADPKVMKRLKAELLDAIPDPNTIPKELVLEKLPYLSWRHLRRTAQIESGIEQTDSGSDEYRSQVQKLHHSKRNGSVYEYHVSTARCEGISEPKVIQAGEVVG
jgi:hypothetical protein